MDICTAAQASMKHAWVLAAVFLYKEIVDSTCGSRYDKGKSIIEERCLTEMENHNEVKGKDTSMVQV